MSKVELDQGDAGNVSEDDDDIDLKKENRWGADEEHSAHSTDVDENAEEQNTWGVNKDPSAEEQTKTQTQTESQTQPLPPPPVLDPDVQKTVEEFEKAAIAQIDDEEYWDDLMERGKLLKLIDAPFQAPIGDDLFGSIRKNNIQQVCGREIYVWT